jgi:hypothetical protein
VPVSSQKLENENGFSYSVGYHTRNIELQISVKVNSQSSNRVTLSNDYVYHRFEGLAEICISLILWVWVGHQAFFTAA